MHNDVCFSLMCTMERIHLRRYHPFAVYYVSVVFENTEDVLLVEVSSFQGVMTREIPLYIVHVHISLTHV